MGLWAETERSVGDFEVLIQPEKYVLVESMEALNMMVDTNKHTRWTHRWRWHNRGCVWAKLASEWAGDEDWAEMTSAVDMREFVTFALMKVRHSVVHRPKNW